MARYKQKNVINVSCNIYVSHNVYTFIFFCPCSNHLTADSFQQTLITYPPCLSAQELQGLSFPLGTETCCQPKSSDCLVLPWNHLQILANVYTPKHRMKEKTACMPTSILAEQRSYVNCRQEKHLNVPLCFLVCSFKSKAPVASICININENFYGTLYLQQ